MAGRGRPRKIQTNVEENKKVDTNLPAYKHLITYIVKPPSAPDLSQGLLSASDVSKILNEQYALGYVVKEVIHIGDRGSDAVGFFYLLERRDINN